MIYGRAWIGSLFPPITRSNDFPCKDPRCPWLKQFPTHFHDDGLACADPDLEGDSA